ncbi:hypothetical protein VNO78_23618 [Psophocarpus tetragonolobus]|uniref:Uncharacterized protein n=1 Tax=Psophocarpus tetragonolobus TaxID=3891 RepID=A0AAN9S4B4_PSOTE
MQGGEQCSADKGHGRQKKIMMDEGVMRKGKGKEIGRMSTTLIRHPLPPHAPHLMSSVGIVASDVTTSYYDSSNMAICDCD